MVLPTTSFLTNTQNNGLLNRPLLNTLPYNVTNNPSTIRSPGFQYKKFWQWFKARPELVAVINVLTTDIIGDRPEFVGTDGKPLGRNKFLQAQRFWRENRVKESVKAILYDMFVTGDGYGWIGKLSADDRAQKAKEIADIFTMKHKLPNSKTSELAIKIAQDEDLKAPKKFDYVASSTVQIENSYQEILSYWQNVSGKTRRFAPHEIIHFRLNTLDGMVQGFSPMEALIAEIMLIYFVKENMLAFMRNGGSPSKVFVLPDELSNSDNHQFLVETLQRYNVVENRNGNLVFTGNVDIKDLASTPKDMEYKEMALYLTSNIAFAFSIPVTRIPYLVGDSATGGDSGGIAESGYWNMISEKQDQIEDLLNLQLFEGLGWNIKLNRKYKQDEVREAQTASMSADTVQKKQAIYKSIGLAMKDGRVAELLGEASDDLRELTPEESMDPVEKTGLMNQNLLDNISVNNEPGKSKVADTKRNVANDGANKGLNV